MSLGNDVSSESITGKLRVGLITDVGKIDDGTFNQYAYEGMIRAAQEFDMDTTCIETSRPEDSEGNVLMLAEGDCHLIVTVGQGLGLVVERVAKDYPDVRFITVDFAPSPPLPNVMSLLFAEDQAGFLAGALAALMAQSKELGAVCGD
ncbi:MAG: BMP family ABC transporter substrate-binding protein [Ardenticatenia bacterium]|nr:BMP family ABC transporter substrate-binding protein [Ardenticatenia bacterium]